MVIHPAFVAPMFNRVPDVDWFSCGGSDISAGSDFAMATVQRYPSERIAPVKRRKVDVGPVVPVMARATDMNCLPGISRKTLSEFEHEYRLYRAIIDDDSGESTDILAEVVEDIFDLLAQDAPWEGVYRSSFWPMIFPPSTHCSGTALEGR